MIIDIEELSKFLVKAKVNTYASDTKTTILGDGSKELVFREGRLFYRDRYFGENPFIGEEMVFHEDKYIWGYELLWACYFFQSLFLERSIWVSSGGIKKS